MYAPALILVITVAGLEPLQTALKEEPQTMALSTDRLNLPEQAPADRRVQAQLPQKDQDQPADRLLLLPKPDLQGHKGKAVRRHV